MFEDTQAVIWRGPHGKELRLPARSEYWLVSELSWKWLLQPQSKFR